LIRPAKQPQRTNPSPLTAMGYLVPGVVVDVARATDAAVVIEVAADEQKRSDLWAEGCGGGHVMPPPVLPPAGVPVPQGPQVPQGPGVPEVPLILLPGGRRLGRGRR
jgi:hypothetical protein